jgi:hypothetical protein
MRGAILPLTQYVLVKHRDSFTFTLPFHIKDNLGPSKLMSLQQLRGNISEAARTQGTLDRAWQQLLCGFDICRVTNGPDVETIHTVLN